MIGIGVENVKKSHLNKALPVSVELGNQPQGLCLFQ